MTTLTCTQLLVGGRFAGPGSITLGGDRIAAVAPSPAGDADLVLEGGVLTAGMVDLQLNGAVGVDFAHADAAGWRAVAAHVAAHGVTAFCPTFITAPVERQRAAIAATGAAMRALAADRGADDAIAGADAADRGAGDADAGADAPVAQPIGAHLEGPFLSPLRPGAHDPTLLREPSAAALDALLDGADLSALAFVTLAPELPGAEAAIARLRAAGVQVSLGHSDATAAQTADAARHGARLVTHLFNAQRAFNHREPGLPARALVDPLLVSGLIVDLRHVAADAVRLAFAAAPGRIALVSDAVAAAGMTSGPFRIGNVEAFAHADGPPTLADGTLAGSALHLDEAVRNSVALGIDRATALTAATAVPAAALGDAGRGDLAAGRRADLVWWDDDLRVRAVWIGGRRIDAGDRAEAGSA
ncbi:amidohydrolase family protein [Conexibacter sp. JD483]|uniref:N-acetylglucosamine-6-phosphate deacetylase n=1 Tax=unclassified Conexibacter TaxID=2627773 RepID=UPI002725D91C|nr:MULTISPECIES: amidohydrolase family protein [unclassified Conexibacter]MDO8188402.1 amidohydrolase family protein [Conexibacter sp. CPCC 205706]MDO8198189.1 amidohydrolase family protein [Conexibacter sp. CPCC 205762]MDR9370675.1 amidohydrolase family protein [Conexibacter sp. JD483]